LRGPAARCASSARVNAETRQVNYAVKREIELRKWRNQMRKMLILFTTHLRRRPTLLTR